MEIHQCVLQGSVLGLLLFLLYINDLPVNIHDANLVMFADDINVVISDSDERLLQTKIDRIVAELETWFNRNDLLINAGKTAVMLCHNRQTAVMLCHNRETHVLVKPSVTFNHRNVHCTAEINYLGIQIKDTLKWHCHVQLLAGKLCCVRWLL